MQKMKWLLGLDETGAAQSTLPSVTNLQCITLKIIHAQSSHHGSAETNPLAEDVGSIPGLAQWVEDQVLLQAEAQVAEWLRSSVAVAVVQASDCSSDFIPSPGTSMYLRCSLKKKRQRKRSYVFNLCLQMIMHQQPSITLQTHFSQCLWCLAQDLTYFRNTANIC